MFTHIKAYAFTHRALKALLPDADPAHPRFPDLWFDWTMPALQDAAGSQQGMRRFCVVADTKYDEYKKAWVRSANSNGVLPCLIATIEDEPPDSRWPQAEADAFSRPIGREPLFDDDALHSDEWEPLDDDWEENVVAIIPLDPVDEEQLEDLRHELALPEQDVLGPWACVQNGDKDEYWAIQAHPAAWRDYSHGLKAWFTKPQLFEMLLRDLGKPRYSRWIEDVQFGWEDFAFKPTAQRMQDTKNELYIPSRCVPFCGIGIENGAVTTFGMFPVNADGTWPFGDHLRQELEGLLTRPAAARGPQPRRHLLEGMIEVVMNAIDSANPMSGRRPALGHAAMASPRAGLLDAQPTPPTRQSEILFEGQWEGSVVKLIREPVGSQDWALRLSTEPEQVLPRVDSLVVDGHEHRVVFDGQIATLPTLKSSSPVRAIALNKEVKCRVRRV